MLNSKYFYWKLSRILVRIVEWINISKLFAFLSNLSFIIYFRIIHTRNLIIQMDEHRQKICELQISKQIWTFRTIGKDKSDE